MARLVGVEIEKLKRNPGEYSVAKALIDALPPLVKIFCNWEYSDFKRGEEGECDFIVLDPDQGLLFLEVKGGAIHHDHNKNVWLRHISGGNYREITNPFEQAKKAKFFFLRKIRQALHGDPHFTFGEAIAFPDCLCTDMTPQILDEGKLSKNLKSNIDDVFSAFRKTLQPVKLLDKEIDIITLAICPKRKLIPVLYRQIENQERQLVHATEMQQELLETLDRRKLALIHGTAGSGKTMIAVAKAQEAAAKGLRTLYLCNHHQLRAWLKLTTTDQFGDNLVFHTFKSLALELCDQAGLQLLGTGSTEEKKADFWTEKGPSDLIKACESLNSDYKFDAIIIDEAQDFCEPWFMSIYGVFRDSNNYDRYFVFHDPHQTQSLAKPLDLEEVFNLKDRSLSLTRNCRNTKRIAEHCSELVRRKSQSRREVPDGVEPKIVDVYSLNSAVRETGRQVNKWITSLDGNLKPNQVAILASPTVANREIWPEYFGNLPIIWLDPLALEAWNNNEGVLISSWAEFKGLEADAVIVIVSREDSARDVDHYVACSRAKHLLTKIQVH